MPRLCLLLLVLVPTVFAMEDHKSVSEHTVWRSSESLLKADKPWEREAAHLYQVGIFPDPEADQLRMYYLVLFRGEPARNFLSVAYSEDGRTWTKPVLGDGTNVVMRSGGNDMDWGFFMPSSIIHDPDATNPTERWKLLYWGRRNPAARPGYYVATSPDGFAWSTVTPYPVITNANDAATFIDVNPHAPAGPRDTGHLVYQQMWRYDAGLPVDRDNLTNMQRVISIWWADPWPDRWVGPAQIFTPDDRDPPDLQFYFMAPYHTPRGYGALISCHHTGNQTMDVQLAFSDDGWTWTRALDRNPIIPLGESGRFDSGMVFTNSRPVQWRGETLVFYTGRATVHDGKPAHADKSKPTLTSGIGVVVIDPKVLGLTTD